MAAKPTYGRPHRRVKEQFRPAVESGQVRCWRCGEFIRPGESWDLGHVDGDPERYAGPEHSRCNRATALHAAQRRARAAVAVTAPSSRASSRPAFWSRHWYGTDFDERCQACRDAGGPCEPAVRWREEQSATRKGH